ncbi:MAG: SDR family oxidoreductase [Deltaproteobacteria bacterium]|nr:SDR family oxidoreductase [Deltaproteobacteria bacterium]MCW5804818.1 SDR family oxidoreductase [Deltaproteobacteria bacterium]
MPNPLDVFRDNALAGHVAIVTGGGTGICRGIAAAYARLGADVCIVSRKQDVLDAAAAAIATQTGRTVLGVAADVRQPDAIARAVTATVERFGKLDTLVNGAAGNFLAPAAALSPNGFRTVIDIDLNGTFNAARAAFEALQRAGDGLILNISATLHHHGTPLQIHASAAKAGVDAVTRNLAVEWGRFGIRVCGIAPGPIADTEGMRRLAPPGEVGDKARAAIPAGRFGTIDEIAAAAVFLRSPAAAYVTGHVLVVDGGHVVAAPPLGMTL